MNLVIALLAGLVVGHGIRRITPAMVQMNSRELPFKFPWVELTGGVTFTLIAMQRGLDLDQIKWMVFAALLLAATSADFFCKYIPDRVWQIGTVLGLVLTGLFPLDISNLFGQLSLVEWLGLAPQAIRLNALVLSFAGAISGFLVLEFVRRIMGQLVNMEVMGMGDSLLMMMIGAFLGPIPTAFSILPACIFGSLVGGIQQAVFKTPHVAFGPFLAFGAMASLLYGGEMIDMTGSAYGLLFDLPPAVLMGVNLSLMVIAVLLILRIKKKAAEYSQAIEEDYAKIDARLEGRDEADKS